MSFMNSILGTAAEDDVAFVDPPPVTGMAVACTKPFPPLIGVATAIKGSSLFFELIKIFELAVSDGQRRCNYLSKWVL